MMPTYGAVAESDGSGKLDYVSSTDRRVLGHERDQVVDTVVDAAVRMERRLDSREQEH